MKAGRVVTFTDGTAKQKGAVIRWGKQGATLLTHTGRLVRVPYRAMLAVAPSSTDVAVAREIVAKAKPGMYVTGAVKGEEFGGIVVEVHETGLEFVATQAPDTSMLKKVGTLRYREVQSITQYGPPPVKAGDQVTIKGETYTVEETNKYGVVVVDARGGADAFTWEDLDEAGVATA